MKKYILDIKKHSIAAVSNLLLFKQILNQQLISNWDQVDRIKKKSTFLIAGSILEMQNSNLRHTFHIFKISTSLNFIAAFNLVFENKHLFGDHK